MSGGLTEPEPTEGRTPPSCCRDQFPCPRAARAGRGCRRALRGRAAEDRLSRSTPPAARPIRDGTGSELVRRLSGLSSHRLGLPRAIDAEGHLEPCVSELAARELGV